MTDRPGPRRAVTVLVTGIVVVFIPILFLIGLVGSLAEGTTLFEVLLLAVVNPLGIGLAAWALFSEATTTSRWKIAAIAAAIALVSNVAAAISIQAGWSVGDAELPLIFAIPFIVFLPYALRRR